MDDKGVFFGAVSLGSPSDREAFLRLHVGVDGPRRRTVDHLLRIHDSLSATIEIQDGLSCPDDPALLLDFLNPSEQPKSLGRLDQHEIVRIIGCDSTGVVLEGYDTKLKRVVSIRALSHSARQSTQARERFERVAVAASAIAGPHVTRLLKGGEQNDTPYLVTEVSPGRSLQQRLMEDGTCSASEIVRIAHESAEGLAAFHASGLVHGDIHPGSIFLAGTEERVKLSFHWADRNPAEAARDVRSNGTSTSEFMSPEQARGESADQRSDLFSLGVVFHALASGESPFAAAKPAQVIDRICHESPPSIRSLNPEAPAWLDDLIYRLLSKVPDQRPQSALDLVERFAGHLVPASSPEVQPQVSYTQRRAGSRRSRVWRICDWSMRILAISCALATFACWYIVTSFEQRELGPLWHVIRGAGAIDIQVDDPRITVSVTSGSIKRHFQGSYRFRLPAGAYLLTASLDEEPLLQKTVWLDRFEHTTWVVNKHDALSTRLEKDPDGYAARWLLRRGGMVHGYWNADVRCTDVVRSIEQLPASRYYLEAVELRNLHPADVAVACHLLAACPRLKTLSIRDSNLSGASLRQLVRLTNLQKLELTHVFDADRNDFSALAALPALEEISLDYSPHAYAFCQAVGGMPHVRSVTITDCPMTDTMLSALCNRADLESLTIHSRFLTEDALDPLVEMRSLKRLELRSPLLTDALWGKLVGLTQLHALKVGSFPAGVSRTRVSDSLTIPPRLREFSLADIVLDDHLLSQVSELSQLSELEFQDSTVESGLLQRLADLPVLRFLRFRNVNVAGSRDELLTLQDQLPQCEVAVLPGDTTIR